MDWQPLPMQMTLLPDFYAQRASGTVLDDEHRVLHPLAAQQLINAQDELYYGASAIDWPQEKPIIVFTTMTRDNAYQYRLVKQNRKHRSAKYPNGIPTATIGKSLHAFGLAVDIDVRATMQNINDAQIDLSFEEFRQFLAGHGIIGIQSEAWHFNLMLRERYYNLPGWKLRELTYGENWQKLEDSQKETLLRLAGCTSASLKEMTVEFQSRYSESLQVDGICGPNTSRAAYCEWAHKNFRLV